MGSSLNVWKLSGLQGSHILHIKVKFNSKSGGKSSISLFPRNVPIASFTDDMGPKGVVMVIKPQGSLAKNGEKYWYWTSQILKVPQVFPSLGNFCCYFLQFRVYNFLIFLSLSEPCPGGIFQQLFSIVEDNGTSWRENKRIPLSNKFGELWFKCNRISFNSRLVGVFGTPIYVVNF